MPDELQNPFVVQCKDCRRVLADSFSLVAFVSDFLVFGAAAPSLCARDTAESDGACVFVPLHCACAQRVGRKYLTATDGVRVNKFCLSRDAVSSFLLGAHVPASEVSIATLAEEVAKLQRFCVTLYKKVQKDK